MVKESDFVGKPFKIVKTHNCRNCVKTCNTPYYRGRMTQFAILASESSCADGLGGRKLIFKKRARPRALR